MAGRHKPRSGSMAYYPRKRSKTETIHFGTHAKKEHKTCKALDFFGYKAGMTHVIGKIAQQKSHLYGQEVSVSATVIECPPLKVVGVKSYGLNETRYGTRVLSQLWWNKHDKGLLKKIPSLKKHKKEADWKTIENDPKHILFLRLVAQTQPDKTNFGKKKSDLVELSLSGTLEQQLEFAKSKFGQAIPVSEVFAEKQFIDVKAVTKGKGIQGPVKRFGVKNFGHKAKYHNRIGTLGPWHPATIMFTVARPGQMGYHTRTDFNKRILMLSDKIEEVNPGAGFQHYGPVQNEFLLVAGTVPGPAKP